MNGAIHKASNLGRFDNETLVNGRYVPARPIPDTALRSRLKAAWMVLTGEADALLWDGQ